MTKARDRAKVAASRMARRAMQLKPGVLVDSTVEEFIDAITDHVIDVIDARELAENERQAELSDQIDADFWEGEHY